MVGTLSLYLAFITGVVSFVLYILSVKKSNHCLNLARKVFYGHLIFTTLASFYLFFALITHKFQYSYVFYYSEKALEFKYLISAFWAGQEGTYLLWAFLGALICLLLIKQRIKGWEAAVLVPLMAIQVVLLFFLLVENPFAIVSPTPGDGFGLNPLLKNPWMVIHPPVVFLGYALLAVPYAFALAALWKKKFSEWVSLVLPWALSGWLTLGAGIIIGAYWAYRVLGWGGYWSWDPVENASLIPWLFAAALIHGLLLQKARNKMIKSNLLLAIFSFVLIIHATFLTRSGLVADFSVHSFSATPLNFYLGSFLFLSLAIGLIAFIIRVPAIKAVTTSYQKNEQLLNKSGMIKVGIGGFVLAGLLVLIGTLAPLFISLGGGSGSVEGSYYVQTTLPIALILTLLMAMSIILNWQEGKTQNNLLAPLLGSFAFTVSGLIFTYIYFVKDWLSLLIIGVSLFAMGTNLYVLIKKWLKQGFKATGAYWSHFGVAIIFIGILGSTSLSESEIAVLPQGVVQEALGYEITFLGREEAQGRMNFPLQVEQNNNSYQVEPQMYVVGRDNRQMREPAIIRYWWGDLYISPLDTQVGQRESIVYLERNETVRFGDVAVTFTGFQAPSHSEEGALEVGAHLIMTYQGEEYHVTPMLVNTVRGWDKEPIDVPGGGFLYLEGVIADEGVAIIHFVPLLGHGAANSLIIEISSRPLIIILFWGTIIMMAGTTLAVWRRFCLVNKALN